MKPENAICMDAVLIKIETTIDGGWRIRFDVPESSAREIMQISALREMALKLVVIPSEIDP